MVIIDTNVLSELMRGEPSGVVLANLKSFDPDERYTTAITEAEIRFGVAMMPEGHKKRALRLQAQAVFDREFVGRVLPFDSAAAMAYAEVAAARRASGRPIAQSDAQIAGIVLSRRGVLYTRNARDFRNCGFEVVNPWLES